MLDVNVTSPLGQGAPPLRTGSITTEESKILPKGKDIPLPASAGCLPDKLHSSFFISSALLFPACGINPHGPLPGFLSPLDLRHHCLIITLFSVTSPNSILWFLYLLPVFPLHLAPSHPPRAFLSTPFWFFVFFLIFFILCVSMPQRMYREDNLICRSRFSPSTYHVRASLVALAFTC